MFSISADPDETTLFLLAHQDDEIAFAPLLSRLKASRQPVCVVYLTDGGIGRVTPERRNAESTRALASLGVAADEITYLGQALSVPNGLLFQRMSQVYSALEAHCSRIGALGEICTLGWEGGNMDHDAAHVIAMALAIAQDRIHKTWQVPFYRASDRGPPFFSLFAPLPANGPVSRLALTRPESRLRANLIRFFPSQWRAFAGLGPAILWHSLVSPVLKLQPMLLSRLWERPTAGPLLYEQRYSVSFAAFTARATEFLGERGITPEMARA
jgi:GlcNAc-PI de-N-acetylase